jgi:hypothetical protein
MVEARVIAVSVECYCPAAGDMVILNVGGSVYGDVVQGTVLDCSLIHYKICRAYVRKSPHCKLGKPTMMSVR